MAGSVVSDNFETSTGAIPNLGGADLTTRLCSAWVNFNGYGTVYIRASYNVSSVTDNGVGDYTVNFTTALADANYSLSGTTSASNAQTIRGIFLSTGTAPTASAVRINTANYVSSEDNTYTSVQIFR